MPRKTDLKTCTALLLLGFAAAGCGSVQDGVSNTVNLTPRDTPIAGPALSLARDTKDAVTAAPGQVIHSFLSAEERQSTPEQRTADRQALRRLDRGLPPTPEDRQERRREENQRALSQGSR